MSKFKVGDRVKRVGYSEWPEQFGAVGSEYTVLNVDDFGGSIRVIPGAPHAEAASFELVPGLTLETGKYYKTRDGRKVGHLYKFDRDSWETVDRDCAFSGVLWRYDGRRYFESRDEGFDIVAEWVDEPVAAHKFKVGDVVNNAFYDRTIAKLITKHGSPAVEYTDGGWDFEKGIKLVSRNEPTPLHVTLGIDLNPSLAPQVGDAVLIKGTLAGITHSHAGTNYNIVFETQNRRVSLHFLEEDSILDGRYCGDCPCANNDNGPAPSADTAKAFDALGSWLNSLAGSRAA